jgi:hypothetical protein
VGEEVDLRTWDGDWRAWICAQWIEVTTDDWKGLVLTRVRPQSTQHPPSQQHLSTPSPPMATIHDLPLEIIGRIIGIAYPTMSPGRMERKKRYGFLKATSLVCREWTPFAQQELWLDVFLYHKTTLSMMEAGAGRHPVQKLFVTSHVVFKNRSENLVQAVLRDVRGVRDLGLSDCPVSIDWLCGDNFKGRRTRHFPVDADF